MYSQTLDSVVQRGVTDRGSVAPYEAGFKLPSAVVLNSPLLYQKYSTLPTTTTLDQRLAPLPHSDRHENPIEVRNVVTVFGDTTVSSMKDPHKLSDMLSRVETLRLEYADYRTNEGTILLSYLLSQGNVAHVVSFGMIDYVAKKDPKTGHEPVMGAGVVVLGHEGEVHPDADPAMAILFATSGTYTMADQLSKKLKISRRDALRYLFEHETVHMSGVYDEKNLEHVMINYYSALLATESNPEKKVLYKKYIQMSEHRLENVEKNYPEMYAIASLREGLRSGREQGLEGEALHAYVTTYLAQSVKPDGKVVKSSTRRSSKNGSRKKAGNAKNSGSKKSSRK